MKVYHIRDYTNCDSVHLALDKESAIQAHLYHYGLLYLQEEPEVISVKELKDVEDRSTICWNPICCLTGATNFNYKEKEE